MPMIAGREPFGSSDKWRHLVQVLKSKGYQGKSPYAIATARAKDYAQARGWKR